MKERDLLVIMASEASQVMKLIAQNFPMRIKDKFAEDTPREFFARNAVKPSRMFLLKNPKSPVKGHGAVRVDGKDQFNLPERMNARACDWSNSWASIFLNW